MKEEEPSQIRKPTKTKLQQEFDEYKEWVEKSKNPPSEMGYFLAGWIAGQRNLPLPKK